MCAKKNRKDSATKEIKNSRAYHKYHVEEKFEAGIALRGTEVKAIRHGSAQINEAFVRIDKDEAWLYNAHISEYNFGTDNNHPTTRVRKLLLHRREINKLRGEMEAKGKTIIPLKLYFAHGLIKLSIAVCTGKHQFDKRQDLKKKIAMREAERDMKQKIKR